MEFIPPPPAPVMFYPGDDLLVNPDHNNGVTWGMLFGRNIPPRVPQPSKEDAEEELKSNRFEADNFQ